MTLEQRERLIDKYNDAWNRLHNGITDFVCDKAERDLLCVERILSESGYSIVYDDYGYATGLSGPIDCLDQTNNRGVL